MLIAIGLPIRVASSWPDFIRRPARRKGRRVTRPDATTGRSSVRQPVFWIMYLMFVLVAAGGLMAVAQLAPIAKDFKIGDVPVSILGLTCRADVCADHRPCPHGLRAVLGWVSDNIGRELTMLIAFAVEGIGIAFFYNFGHDPLLFVILSGLVFFAWGEIYSLFPSTNADTFGSKFAAKRRAAVHGQGDSVATGAAVERVDHRNGQLARSLHCRGHEHRCCVARLVRVRPTVVGSSTLAAACRSSRRSPRLNGVCPWLGTDEKQTSRPSAAGRLRLYANFVVVHGADA